jgi:hypothetical protein
MLKALSQPPDQTAGVQKVAFRVLHIEFPAVCFVFNEQADRKAKLAGKNVAGQKSDGLASLSG